MSNLCIYCGKKEPNERDHIPPKSFFPEPRPSNLITVPSCSDCNREYGKTDEIVRNLLTSLDTTEIHQAVIEQLGDKRNRALERNGGIHSFKYLLENITLVDRFSESGSYLGKFPAFKLDTDVMDKFIERMARGLLFHLTGIGFGNYTFEWKLSPPTSDFYKLPENIKTFFLSGYKETFGDSVFSYAGYTWPGKISSLWLMSFYSGIEFMIIVRD
jgi:HNH endonuclease